MSLPLEFCGEWFHIDPGEPFLVGREGPLESDDNQYLHRRFLVTSHVDGMWWIESIGVRLSATLADAEGATQAYLQPGARSPLVYADITLLFTAGRTTYEMRLVNNQPVYVPSAVFEVSESGVTIVGSIELTNSQLFLVLVLSEPVLTGRGTTSSIPSSQSATDRPGWPITRFNRKLDHVCGRLTRYGMRGLHGGPEKLAVNRRARPAEHAAVTRLVTSDMLYRPEDPAVYDDANQAMDTGNALNNMQVWAQHVIRWRTATSGDAVASGDGLIAQMLVFTVTDLYSDVLLAREIPWVIVDAFSVLRAAHPDGPLVRHVHDLWRDVTRGIAHRVTEATILKNRGGIGDVDDARFVGLTATRIEDRPTWIAVSPGEMGIVTVDERGAAELLPQFNDAGYDLLDDLWTTPMEAGQHFVVAAERARTKLTGNQVLVALGQLRRAEQAASAVLSQSVTGAGIRAGQAMLVIDALTPEDEAALASPPILEGEAESKSDLPASQLSGPWGLEVLGIDHNARPCAPRRLRTAPSVLDNFHFVSYFSPGGLSDVHLYEEQLPKWLVTIKVLSRTVLGEGDSSQLRDEADPMTQLSGHPSVIEIHDVDVAEPGQPYAVMRYCPMPPLTERPANGPLSIEDALKMGVQVASAVYTAHAMGIVHHDLKPANVLHPQFGCPLLGDFGIITLVGVTNQDVMGASLPQAAPEVFLSQQADVRADVYSLVMTVYTALSGHAPFATDDAFIRRECITYMFATQFAPLGPGEGQLQEAGAPDNAGAFERLDEVFMAAVKCEAGKRTATAAEFGWQLQEIQATLGYRSMDLEVLEQRIRSPRTVGSKVRGIFLIRAKIGVFFVSARLCGYDWRRVGGILPYLPR